MTRPASGDIWGGFSSAIVILPQAMAFGVALWAQFGGDLAAGALAGLIAAAFLSLFSGVLAGTNGMISAPTGPTAVLMGGTILALVSSDLNADLLPQAIVIVLMMAGVFQLLIGVFNIGHLIIFIPYPVTAGFMTGSGLLMVVSQANPVLGTRLSEFFDIGQWLPFITALVTFLAMTHVPKRLAKIPPTVAGLIFGTIAYYFMLWVFPVQALPHWVIGDLPDFVSMEIGISLQTLPDMPWGTILAASLALAVLASLDTLLTSVIADVNTGERHHARRELIGQGLGQMFSGFMGGIAGAGTTGATVVAINSGGRQRVAIIAALVIVLFVLLLAKLAAYLPISVLAGIILHVAIMNMLDRNIPEWIRRKRTRMDGFIAAAVTLVTVTYDLMIAVGVGVSIAVLQFIHAQMKTPVIRSRSTAAQRSSLRKRPESVREILAEQGHHVIRYELQGNLFFGTVDRLYTEVSDDLDHPNWVILDMSRVSQVDLTAARLFQQMATRLDAHGGELIFATVRRGKGLGKKVKKTLRKINPRGQLAPIKTFIDTDESLEYAEDRLLRQLGEEDALEQSSVALKDVELFKDLNQEELQALTAVLRKKSYKAGENLFYKGDQGDQLFIITSGEVDAILPFGRRHYKRLATFGPGTFLGEVSFLKPGPRTATGRVTINTEVYILNNSALHALQENHPNAAIAILTALGQALSEHLRWADYELQRVID